MRGQPPWALGAADGGYAGMSTFYSLNLKHMLHVLFCISSIPNENSIKYMTLSENCKAGFLVSSLTWVQHSTPLSPSFYVKWS